MIFFTVRELRCSYKESHVKRLAGTLERDGFVWPDMAVVHDPHDPGFCARMAATDRGDIFHPKLLTVPS
ncbi:hypothetical protein [Arthrobacter glacialis]|uniref:hypothetical protein n=1 Tax=Arthrobacter glacialis TaxID=1664 RepID=UPI001057133E|nr:hypothetical protein [Arthrobacter glacialis]